MVVVLQRRYGLSATRRTVDALRKRFGRGQRQGSENDGTRG